MDKKSADEYDKMLDMADNLAEVFAQSTIELTEALSEELSIYLAQNREDVLVALLAKKASKSAEKKSPKLVDVNEVAEEGTTKISEGDKESTKVAKTKPIKTKVKKNKADEIISEAG